VNIFEIFDTFKSPVVIRLPTNAFKDALEDLSVSFSFSSPIGRPVFSDIRAAISIFDIGTCLI